MDEDLRRILAAELHDAGFLEISPETVKRDWKMAKAWLFAALTGDQDRTSS